MNPLLQLRAIGQSLWVDDIRRAWLTDGTVRSWIEEDGVAGMTSNPAIFEKAISAGEEYRGAVTALAARGLAPLQVYEELVLEDVRAAADVFAQVHQASDGADGFVSLEVSPLLADDTEGTLAEARRLWRALDRANTMIKVPATAAGLPAIRELIAEGINVNVTLIFGLRRYAEVVEMYLQGLERRVAQGLPVDRIASVASFFISRIDTAVDARLDALGTPQAAALRGGAAIAAARMAWRSFGEWTAAARWRELAARGAKPQRLLWASTSTKDPAYDALLYVEALAGPQTVNTLPRATLDAYRQGGRPEPRLQTGGEEAARCLQELQQLGIDMEEVAVVDGDGNLAGIISLTDLAHEARRQQTRQTRDLTGHDVTVTLASICEARQGPAG